MPDSSSDSGSSASPPADAAEAPAPAPAPGEASAADETSATTTSVHSTSTDSNPKVQTATKSLASIITTTTIPTSLPHLLSDTAVSSAISSLLRQPDSGAGGNNLCRWLYDTFQSSDPSLQLLVLRFVPLIAGLYLSRVPLRRPQAGFEALLLAFYAHETTSRAGQALTVNIPDLSHPSVYHDAKGQARNNISTNLNIAVVSPTLEPHGTVRSTRRARIVGVVLELYYSKISKMPRESKLDFCEFCERWAGQNGETEKKKPAVTVSPNLSDAAGGRDDDNSGGGRIHLPWELLQPILRIIGHCLLGQTDKNSDVPDAANRACQSLYLRSLHDINPKAILATGSLLRLREMALDPKNQIDYTEISNDAVISV